MSAFFKRVLLTTLIAGTLDIVSAYVNVYVKAHIIYRKMFQYIATGALGPDTAMKGGWSVIFLGVLIHYFIAFAFTIFFFLIYLRFHLLSINKYIAGIVYGAFIWCMMNLVVLPLSRLPHVPFNLQSVIINILILMIMIGLPISISAHGYYKQRRLRNARLIM